jgi:hypothetical protein
LRYPDLQQRFEPDTIIRQEFTNDEGELVANFSSNRLLNSYEVLLCHKCFAYDCIMHNGLFKKYLISILIYYSHSCRWLWWWKSDT